MQAYQRLPVSVDPKIISCLGLQARDKLAERLRPGMSCTEQRRHTWGIVVVIVIHIGRGL